MAAAGDLTFDSFDGPAPVNVAHDAMDPDDLGALSLAGDHAARVALRARVAAGDRAVTTGTYTKPPPTSPGHS